MFWNRLFSIVTALTLAAGLAVGASAAEVDCDSVYCFSQGDFPGEEPLQGICITQLPDAAAGTLLLDSRVLRPGDILTAEQVERMTFVPLRTGEDTTAQLCYLPIYDHCVAPAAAMSIAIRGKEDKPPVAQDMAMETYKNLPNEAQLKASDPEGQALTYTVVRKPKRGEVMIRKDGSILYTPFKNKVGVDSFTYTAADPAGNVSREATVTVQIVKPTDTVQYQDTVGQDCRFAAEWLRNCGLFVGEQVGDENCFYPEKTVTRGQFLAMVVKELELPRLEQTDALLEQVPQWLKPYAAAALRAGLTNGLPEDFMSGEAAITGAEAALILQNALDLTMEGEAQQEQTPAWAADALTVLAQNGIVLDGSKELTRGEVACALYEVSRLAPTAPGTRVLRIQN